LSVKEELLVACFLPRYPPLIRILLLLLHVSCSLLSSLPFLFPCLGEGLAFQFMGVSVCFRVNIALTAWVALCTHVFVVTVDLEMRIHTRRIAL
jgi:hypothetical protein